MARSSASRWALSVTKKTLSRRMATPRLVPSLRIAEQAAAGRTRIVPKTVAGEGVEGEDLVRAGDVEHAAGCEGRGFEAEVGDGEDPFQLERGDIRGVDLCERAVAICGVAAVVGEPVAGLRRVPGDFSSGLGRGHGSEDGVGIDAAEVFGEGYEIAGGQIGERGHAGAGIAVLQVGAQFVRRLFGDARIQGEAGTLRGAARILAVTWGAAGGEYLLGE